MTLKHQRIDQLCSYVGSAMEKTQMELIQIVDWNLCETVLEQTDTHTPYIGFLNDIVIGFINSDIYA
jgi:hypothetical protein